MPINKIITLVDIKKEIENLSTIVYKDVKSINFGVKIKINQINASSIENVLGRN